MSFCAMLTPPAEEGTPLAPLDTCDHLCNILVQCLAREEPIFTADEATELGRILQDIVPRPDWKKCIVYIGDHLFACMHDELQEEIEIGRRRGSRSIMPPALVKISYRQVVYEFLSKDQRVVSVGRQKGCDVVLNDPGPPYSCSRLHCLIFFLPMGRVLIADVNSFHGVKINSCSNPGLNHLRSCGDARRLLNFDGNDRVELMLGCEQVVVTLYPNPFRFAGAHAHINRHGGAGGRFLSFILKCASCSFNRSKSDYCELIFDDPSSSTNFSDLNKSIANYDESDGIEQDGVCKKADVV